MQIAKLCDDVFAGAEHEVISVCENNLRASGGDVIGEDAFDGPLSADGHEGGGVEGAVGGGDAAETRGGLYVGRRNFEPQGHWWDCRVRFSGRTLVGVVEEFSDCSDWFEPSADVERKRGRMRSILYAHEGGQGPEQGRLFG